MAKWGSLCMCKYRSVPENASNTLVLLHLGRIAEDCLGCLLRTEARWQAVAVSNKVSVI